jgi:serine/threonine protein kinase
MKAPSFFSARRRTPGQRPAEGLPSEAPAVEPYKPLFEIGRGGMGVVTLALARGPERFAKLVVLKRLHEHLLTDPASVQMLLDEARISARLAHPNVVQVHEATLHRGAPTIVMEYLEGLALPELMGQEAPLPLPLHLAVLIQVLRGLDAAHELVDYDGKPLQLVHRDMSPHNVFVGYDGVVKVLDFGIAKVIGSDEGATRTGVLKGKLRYMSPEQIAGGELDRRCDLFSVGVMLWEAITGRRLWGDSVDGHVVRGLIAGQIPALPPGQADPRLERVCQRALAANPEQRYATAVQFRQDLQGCLEAASGQLIDDGLSRFLLQRFGARRDEMRARVAERIQRTTSRPPPPSSADAQALALPRRSVEHWLGMPARRLAVGGVSALVLLGGLAAVQQHFAASSTPGASAAGALGPAGHLRCDPGSKSCDGRCVSSERPEHGCGSAGCAPCRLANATPRCGRDGACSIAVCYRGYDDCDGHPENGCETLLRTDVNHCGSCSAACPPLPHATVGCGDSCRIWRCDVDHEDCNGSAADGCEVALSSDLQHCGACGNRCPATLRCEGGSCVQ